jgi:hypothetical protein
MKSIILILIAISISGIAFGAMPPETINKLNIEADEILIGEIISIHNAPSEWCASDLMPGKSKCRYFLLRVKHAIRSKGSKNEGDIVKICFVEYLTAIRGPKLVRVNIGDLVVVYANHSASEGQVLILPAAGDSVVTIESPLQ